MLNLVADRQSIGDALAQLSAEHRAVIRRSYYEARTTAQIADDLQIAEATVKSRLHYAMRALLRAVQEIGVTETQLGSSHGLRSTPLLAEAGEARINRLPSGPLTAGFGNSSISLLRDAL